MLLTATHENFFSVSQNFDLILATFYALFSDLSLLSLTFLFGSHTLIFALVHSSTEIHHCLIYKDTTCAWFRRGLVVKGHPQL